MVSDRCDDDAAALRGGSDLARDGVWAPGAARDENIVRRGGLVRRKGTNSPFTPFAVHAL